MAARNLHNGHLGRQAVFDNPQRFSHCPSPPLRYFRHSAIIMRQAATARRITSLVAPFTLASLSNCFQKSIQSAHSRS